MKVEQYGLLSKEVLSICPVDLSHLLLIKSAATSITEQILRLLGPYGTALSNEISEAMTGEQPPDRAASRRGIVSARVDRGYLMGYTSSILPDIITLPLALAEVWTFRHVEHGRTPMY